MQAVGRLGSYISKRVYTVSGPFHPFGGAVDIIVVLQPDGSFKSSPWYVRFGKFQGVLKTKEKLVKISVNGVEADFQMHLDRKGGAYFEKEVDTEGDDSACSAPSTSGEDTDGQHGDRWPMKSKSCNDANWSDSNVNGSAVCRTNSRRSQILGLVFGNRSKVNGITQEECESNVVRTESMERAEIAADLLELNWSTPRRNRDDASRFFSEDRSKDIGENLNVDDCNTDEISAVSHSSSINHVQGDTTSSNSELTLTDNLSQAKEGDCINSVTVISEESVESANCSETVHSINEVKSEPEREMLIGQENSNIQECLRNGDQNTFFHVEKTRISLCPTSEGIVTESYLEAVHLQESDDSVNEMESRNIPTTSGVENSTCTHIEEQNVMRKDKLSNHGSPVRPVNDPQMSNEEPLQFGKLDDIDSSQSKCFSDFSVDQSFVNGYEEGTNLQKRGLRNVSSDANINTSGDVQSKELTRTARSLPSVSPISNGFDASVKSEKDYENNDHQSPCGVYSTTEDIEIIKESKDGPQNPSIETPPRPIEGSRRSWPFSFKRSRSMEVSPPGPAIVGTENSKEETSIGDITNNLDHGDKTVTTVNSNKRKIIGVVSPTSEQLASLNLKEGKNIVIFTFTTAMLGQQQVDARIFLWRWDARVVISDVDGTITRSDLLGQVMPLVGMDWSQTGVAHFFSAIKENGYQFLFLSARSISQAFLTRQFLFNIKQDGKALPDGPVVISPDGLFPSLYREVVRRAPHEFKIACLEDIKVLFPADTTPFYAGFGNRDTDEFSYLKVGIPRSKIFIINPKGEIVVNRRLDTKSYVSLHTLVHEMFPTMMSSSEQEDFNTWNYWKLPPPNIDI